MRAEQMLLDARAKLIAHGFPGDRFIARVTSKQAKSLNRKELSYAGIRIVEDDRLTGESMAWVTNCGQS